MSKQLYTVSKEGLEYLCGLINKIITLPSDVIDNLNLSDITTFSSTKIDALINQTLLDANTHAEELCNALIKLTCKKTTVQPTLDNSELNIIYLFSSDGNAPFEQYLKISDTELIDMGSTSISLNDYLTVTDAVSTYAKKVDLDTLTTEVTNIKSDLNTHKNDTDIHVTTSDKEKWNGYNDTINEMKQNFQGGVNTIYDSVVEKGVTPVDKSPSEIAIAISKILGGDLTSIYNALTDKGLTMSGTESDSQVAIIISDLLTIKSFTTRTDSNTFVFNGTKYTIKDTELLDTSSGLILEFNSEELTSVESGDYIEFSEINKTEYNNKLKFI